MVESGARQSRPGLGDRPEIVWAPLVDHGGQSRDFVRSTAAYSVLNSSSVLQARWGLDRGAVDKLRRRLVASGAASAADLVPVAAIDDLIVSDPDPTTVGAIARRIGATSMALPAFSIDGLGEQVAWAREVLAAGAGAAAAGAAATAASDGGAP
jgi:hypothetical protein